MWTWLGRRRRGAGAGSESPATGANAPDVEEDVTDEEILDRVAFRIVRMRMTVPAILFLESSKPLSFVGSQFLVFMEPFVKTFFTAALYDRFAALMEDREQYELLIRKIERLESEGPVTGRQQEGEKNDG